SSNRLRRATLFWLRLLLDLAVVDQLLDHVNIKGFALEQGARDQMHLIRMLSQDRLRLVVTIADDRLHLLIDLIGNRITIVLLMAEITAQEYLPLGMAELHRSELIAHPVFHNHAAHDTGCFLE